MDIRGENKHINTAPMIRRLALTALLLALPGALAAQDGAEPVARADLGYASRYVFRGLTRAGASVQSGLEYEPNETLRASLWANAPFHRGETGELEASITGQHKFAGQLTLEALATAYYFPDAVAGATRHSFEIGLAASWQVRGGLATKISVFRDLRLRATTLQAALACSVALPRLGTFLEGNLYVGWADGGNWRPDAPGPARRDGYSYVGADAQVPYRISPHVTVIGGLHCAEAYGNSPTNGPITRQTGRNCWVSLGLSLDF